MENYDFGESEVEILHSKNFTILFDFENNTFKNLSILLYSTNIIEFSMNIIRPSRSECYKEKFEFQFFKKFENDNFNGLKNIFEYFCELIQNNIDLINFDEETKILILKESNKEYSFNLKTMNTISEYDIVKILFNEMNKKAYSNDLIPNLNLKKIEKIKNQMNKSICCIIKNNDIIGNGFFALIKKENKFISLLITNNNIINENDINNEINIIIVLYNNQAKNIKLRNNTNHYINEEYGVSIYELKETINNIQFLEFDESIIENNKEKINTYNNQSIYTIQYKKEKEDIILHYGKLDSIKENANIKHKCSSNDISLGSPILLSKNSKIIGMHIDNKNDIAKLLSFPLSEFLNNYKNEKIQPMKEKDVNEIKIERSSTDEDINNIIHIHNNNKMIIEYINSNKENVSIKIFSKHFVNNNKTKCVIKYRYKIYDLVEELQINSQNETFKIILEEKENEALTNISYMFHRISSLKSVDISNFNTEKITDMRYMFSDCTKLITLIGFENINTDNVENMSNMFYGCQNLSNFPNISSWNMNKVKDISKMFMNMGINNFPNLDKWDMPSVENMSGLFSQNNMAADNISFISKWKNISKITDISYLFSECERLRTIPNLSNWDVSNVTNMSYLFNKCTNLKYIPVIDKWEVKKVEKINKLFSDCENLISIPDISNWDVSSVDDMSYLFNNCKQITSLPNLKNWKTSNVNDMCSIFNGCIKLNSIPDISLWDTSKVKNMSNIFNNCIAISTLPDISKWKTSNVENISGIFCRCSSIKSLPDISEWKTYNITNMSKMFCECNNLLSLPEISKWNYKKVINMKKFCYNCKELKGLPKGYKKNKFNDEIYWDEAFKGCGFDTPKFLCNEKCVIY